MTVTDDLFNYLEQYGPLNCTQRDIAHDLGISETHLSVVLWRLRRPEVVAVNGWTVPFQHGPIKAWRVIGTRILSKRDAAEVRTGLHERLKVCESYATRTRALATIVQKSAPKSSPVGNVVQTALIQIDAAMASLELAANIV